MSSFISGNYLENLARIHNKGTATKSAARSENAKSFAEILSEIDEKNKPTLNRLDSKEKTAISTVRGATTAPTVVNQQQPVVSNLDMREKAMVLSPLPSPVANQRSEPHGRFTPGGYQAESAVKSTPEKVNIPTPAPKVGMPPKPPVIVSELMQLGVSSRVEVRHASVQPQAAVRSQAGGVPNPPRIKFAKLDHSREIARTLSGQEPKRGKDYSSVELEGIIHAAGKHHGINPQLSMAVARAESGLRTDAVSRDGHRSKGIFQLLDATGKELHEDFGIEDHYNPFDPNLNAFLGVGYLKQLHEMFSGETKLTRNLKTQPANSAADLEKIAVAAYNAGQGNVARAQEKAMARGLDPGSYSAIKAFLPASTRDYVVRVARLKSNIDNLG